MLSRTPAMTKWAQRERVSGGCSCMAFYCFGKEKKKKKQHRNTTQENNINQYKSRYQLQLQAPQDTY